MTAKRSFAASCLACGSADLHELMQVRDLPILCNVLRQNRSDALRAPIGDLELMYCERCGHIFNGAFDASLIDYDPEYENSLHFSDRFQYFANELIYYLVESYDIKHKTVVDIGCGKGDFLAALCRVGQNEGSGFDKSYSGAVDNDTSVSLRIIRDCFSEQHRTDHASLICCRHVLEHIDHPTEFVRMVRRSMRCNRDAVVYCEVPNSLYTVHDLGIWDMIYEHRSYFNATSLLSTFLRSGFSVLRVASLYGHQFVAIEARLNGATGDQPDLAPPSGFADEVASFPKRYRQKVRAWQEKFDQLARSGKRTVIWGAGSKGVTMLNIVKPENIDYVIDVNPRKHGKHVAVTGQQIVPPEFLVDYRPDAVVIMNPLYGNEIRERLRNVGLSPALLAA